MHKPHLIDDLKYDLRVYAVVVGMNPPRVYVYKDGLARFATTPYEKPHERNLKNLTMHLTNVAINKFSNNYEHNKDKNNDDVGSKRSLASVLDTIDLEKG